MKSFEDTEKLFYVETVSVGKSVNTQSIVTMEWYIFPT